ncbi:uncharacterized protein M437DRAFT_84968 [Aureobasidium melanogenum CBS 110374]|uniref:Uncharacterized protein n=1 Tax=Aureobasidium melanogenum (strain CBS 110374) TaxID=1043003 RepID=A0A074VS54_AURM1|nr:uncharacterized protein M437DRAFT_84968 [Aureobasidium melanogenum CBS 110374]KEQ62054.1 hypothetical protein M437DRAFT_84968 [Aureobasidium melanogenum CBS 110374]
MSTRYTNAVVNGTLEAAFTYKKFDGIKRISVPPHFAGLEQDDVISREWLQKMEDWQHKLDSSIN